MKTCSNSSIITFLIQLIISNTLFGNFILGFYQNKDPLQPVWDNIDQLSNKILEDMELRMTKFTSDLNTAVDEKIEDLKSSLIIPSVSQSSSFIDNAKYISTIHSITEYVTVTFEDLYNANMLKDNEAVLTASRNNINILITDLETKIPRHFDQTIKQGTEDSLFESERTSLEIISGLREDATSLLAFIIKVDENVTSIKELVASAADVTCESMGYKIQRFINELQPSQERVDKFENEWIATYQAIVEDIPAVFFHRDCSDILWSNASATSGVYTIHPTHVVKREVRVWCDMEAADNEGNAGGWTVVLRRRNTSTGLLNFNRSWEDYSAGFGEVGNEGEWWLGLNWLHELTYYQPYQVTFLLHEMEGEDLQAHYSTFRVEDESQNFRLIVDGFTGNVYDAFKGRHHGQPFSTPDRDNDNCDTCNCALNNQGGWWFNVCHWTSLTSPFPTSYDADAKTIKWLSGKWLVLDDVSMLIRPTSYLSKGSGTDATSRLP